MAGVKTGRARLEVAIKRLFSATFDQAEPLPEDITVKRADLEAVLLCFRVRFMAGSVPESPNLNPNQR